MKILKCFNDYIKESYLKGGRQPLYTWVYRIKNMMNDDVLKMGNPTMDKKFRKNKDPKQIKSISLSRSSNFNFHGFGSRLVLDTDKLLKDGYKPIHSMNFQQPQINQENLIPLSQDTSKNLEQSYIILI